MNVKTQKTHKKKTREESKIFSESLHSEFKQLNIASKPES